MQNNPTRIPSQMKAKATGFILALLLLIFTASAQNAGINADGSAPDKSAMLDIKSSNKGLLIPRVSLKSTIDVTTVPTPQTSLLVFNTASSGNGNTAVSTGFHFWNGQNWVPLTTTASTGSNGNSWGLTGNAGTNFASQFLGTTDNKPLAFRINNQPAGLLGNTGNVFWGLQSGASSTIAYSNVAIGNGALRNNTDRPNLVAIGDSALFNNGTGAGISFNATQNTAVGSKAAFANTTGDGNTAIGFNSLMKSINGQGNTGVGSSTLRENTSGSINTAVGNVALRSNTTGRDNVAIGGFTLDGNTTGDKNTAVGSGALFNAKASGNTAIGSNALIDNTTGFSNVAIGIDALRSNTVRSNLVAIGDSALFNNGRNATVIFHGESNVAIGSKAAFANTIGSNNTAVGHNALQKNISGGGNTSAGAFSLRENTTGATNTAFGNLALLANTTGNNNTAVGSFALEANATGEHNTAVGNGALFNSKSSNNTSVGFNALVTTTTGGNNTALGANANVGLATHVNATAIGANAFADCSNCMVLGSTAGFNGAPNSIKVGIGTTNPLRPLTFASGIGDKISLFESPVGHYGFGIQGALLQIHTDNTAGDIAFGSGSSFAFNETMRIRGGGNVGIGTKVPSAKLTVAGNILASGSVTSFSDKRFKKDITPVNNVLEAINHLQGVYYFWNIQQFPDNGFTEERQLGFIAQDIEKYFPEMVKTDAQGYKSVDYGRMTPVLLEAIKEQQKQIDALKKLVEEKLH
jgi:hypothetical protein